MQKSQNKPQKISTFVRNIEQLTFVRAVRGGLVNMIPVLIIGAFALVFSIFGRPLWKWFALLALGLVVVAVANAIINYFASSDGTSSNNRIKFNDTLN